MKNSSKISNGVDIKKNISLAKHISFKIGGSARYFCIAKSKRDLIEAIKWAKQKKVPFFVLGGGSNVLALDQGYEGLVIKIRNSRFIIHNSEIYAEAGTKLEDLVKLSARQFLTGLEWAAGIPGTIGGAVYGNAQAFDIKMSDIVKSVEILNVKTLNPVRDKSLNGVKIKKLSKKQCQFSNKNSIFKKNKNLIILSVILKIKRGNKEKIKKEIREHLNFRKQRHPLSFPSAGSIFVNQESRIMNQELLKEFPELREFNKEGIISSSYLIEKAGLKGTKIGGVKVSEKHAGFIVNTGEAKAKDVLDLIKIIKQKVKSKFGITLKEEIQIINT